MSQPYDLPESPDIDDKLWRLECMIEALACAMFNSRCGKLTDESFVNVAEVIDAIQGTSQWERVNRPAPSPSESPSPAERSA